MKVLWITTREQEEPAEHWIGEEQRIAVSASDAVAYLATETIDAVVFNATAAGRPAIELLAELRQANPSAPIVVRVTKADMAEAVRLTKAGAFHVIRADAPDNELNAVLGAAVQCHPPKASQPPVDAEYSEEWRRTLVGGSAPMWELVEFIRLAGPRRCTVLLSGETGTGKELVARALHAASPRAARPMVSLNCAALPEHLLEAELFGHVRGAYTGALTSRVGRFEQAHHGTLFLDEIADMPFDLQAKLLRVLQERELQRLGSSETVQVDVRVIAACNVDLLERMQSGRFREDLYYRLAVVPFTIAPLRERAGDIPALVAHFIEQVAEREDLPLKRVTPETMARLLAYDWPGNVRQLENVVEMAMILSGERRTLDLADFRLPAAAPRRPVQSVGPPVISVPDNGLDFERTVGQIELSLLEQALRKTRGNKKQAAEMLRLKRTTLAAKLKSLETLAG
jgi:DNA-binding NtrC family response regulator